MSDDNNKDLADKMNEDKVDDLALLFEKLENHYAAEKIEEFNKTLDDLSAMDANKKDPKAWEKAIKMQMDMLSMDKIDSDLKELSNEEDSDINQYDIDDDNEFSEYEALEDTKAPFTKEEEPNALIINPKDPEETSKLIDPVIENNDLPIKETLKEIFETKNAAKISLIGGKGIGKSYLFQAMVYRSWSNQLSGALSYYLDCDSTRLVAAQSRQDPALLYRLTEYLESYEQWLRLDATKIETQLWFRLELPYRKGLLGLNRGQLAIEFYDGAGEFFESDLDESKVDVWENLTKSNIMVFCLPYWVVFPSDDISDADYNERRIRLNAFDKILSNYKEIRRRTKQKHSVFSILALTQADDRRAGGNEIISQIQENWIEEYMNNTEDYLKALRKPHNVLNYLKNAKKISKLLLKEMSNNMDPKVSSIVSGLDLGRGKPWLMPVSAIEGHKLQSIEEITRQSQSEENFLIKQQRTPPIPVHVELPLLVALCEYTNALI